MSIYGSLSLPLKFTGDFEADICTAYDYFQRELNDQLKRPTLYGKKVYIEARERINSWPEGFWHVISLEESHKFKVLPCVNDENINLCLQNCEKSSHSIEIKQGSEKRNICLLRASRLPWIIDIINLANKNDSAVNVWLKTSNKRNKKLYLRYNQYGADYVVIFSVEKHFYRMISAFPVFYSKEKITFDEESINYKWSYFEAK